MDFRKLRINLSIRTLVPYKCKLSYRLYAGRPLLYTICASDPRISGRATTATKKGGGCTLYEELRPKESKKSAYVFCLQQCNYED